MTTEKPHPISLQEVFFVRSIVVAIQGHTPGEDRLSENPTNKIDVATIDGKPGQFNASMRTIINPNSEVTSPYFIDMECIAVLTSDNTLSADEALRGITITAHNVLYGAIREAVAWLTARQPYGPMMLGLSVLKSAPMPTNQTP